MKQPDKHQVIPGIGEHADSALTVTDRREDVSMSGLISKLLLFMFLLLVLDLVKLFTG